MEFAFSFDLALTVLLICHKYLTYVIGWYTISSELSTFKYY